MDGAVRKSQPRVRRSARVLVLSLRTFETGSAADRNAGPQSIGMGVQLKYCRRLPTDQRGVDDLLCWQPHLRSGLEVPRRRRCEPTKVTA